MTGRAARVLVALAIVLLAGCSARQTIGGTPSPAGTQRAPASAVAATPAPPADAEAKITKGALHVITRTDSIGQLRIQAIQEVTNEGTGWADLGTRGDMTVFAKDGSVAETGSTEPAPRYLAPGATGYLLGQVASGTLKAANVGEIDVSGRFETEDTAPPQYPATRVTFSAGSMGDKVTGLMENDSGKDHSLFSVHAIYFAASGKPLGFNSTYIQEFPAGETKAFSMESTAKTSGVDSVKVFGSTLF